MLKINISGFLLLLWIPLCPSAHAATNLIYEYDANGNLIQGDGKYYEYNDANRLVRVRHGDAGGPVIAEYVYDHTGQRIKKMENGETTYYIGKHFQKQITPEKTADSSFYFANGQRVAKKDAATGALSYYHLDHLGGTNVVTDAGGGVVERVSYYPFGDIREGGREQYTYTGKEKDDVAELYYFEARYYGDGYRHFTQADTILPNVYDPQSLNRYAYVKNNPLRFVDPTGHFIADWLGEKIFQYTTLDAPQGDFSAQAAYYGARVESLDKAITLFEGIKKTADGLMAVLSLGGGSGVSTTYSILTDAIMKSEDLAAMDPGAWQEFAFDSMLDIGFYKYGKYNSSKIHPNAKWTWNQFLADRVGPKRINHLEGKVLNKLRREFINLIKEQQINEQQKYAKEKSSPK